MSAAAIGRVVEVYALNMSEEKIIKRHKLIRKKLLLTINREARER